MVGRKTSQGCETCRKRKAKCGREQPECLQCVRSKWSCPGYERQWIASSSASRSRTFEKDLDGHVIKFSDPANQVRLDASSKLRSEFCWRINNRSVAADLHVIPWVPYLEILLERIGHNAALDNAIRLSICNTSPAIPLDSTRYWKQYGSTLNSLREAITLHHDRLEPTTLAAIFMVRLVEHYHNPGSSPSMIHLKGLKEAIKANIAAFEDCACRMILNAEIGNMITEAALGNEDCFLELPEWQEILARPVPGDQIVKVMQTLGKIAASPPRFFRRFRELVRAVNASGSMQSGLGYEESKIQDLIYDLESLMQTIDSFVKHDLGGLSVPPVESLEQGFAENIRYNPLHVLATLRSSTATFSVLTLYMIQVLELLISKLHTRHGESSVHGTNKVLQDSISSHQSSMRPDFDADIANESYWSNIVVEDKLIIGRMEANAEEWNRAKGVAPGVGRYWQATVMQLITKSLLDCTPDWEAISHTKQLVYNLWNDEPDIYSVQRET